MSVVIDTKPTLIHPTVEVSLNEPEAGEVKRVRRMFAVQRHLGSILHYDLRIEINGVLKSWALPSGPSMNAGDPRLAIPVGDKPVTFATLKRPAIGEDGIIEGWDKGVMIPHSTFSSGCDDSDLLAQLDEGRLRFTLRGRKLKGVFSLIRMNDSPSAYWVLLKGNDKYAVNFKYNAEQFISSRSLISKRLRLVM
jgi:bifunctional non-homologous end joining protein LigD